MPSLGAVCQHHGRFRALLRAAPKHPDLMRHEAKLINCALQARNYSLRSFHPSGPTSFPAMLSFAQTNFVAMSQSKFSRLRR